VTPSAVGAPRLLAFAMTTLGGLAWPALLPATTYALVGSVLGASGAGSDASGAGAGAVSWALAAPQLSQCPPGWSLTTSGSCWQLAPPTQLLTQPASQAYCAGLGAGGGLATPQNQADWLLLLNLSAATPILRTKLWTGLMVPPATRTVPSTYYLMRNYSNATAAFAATRFAASSPTGVGPCVQLNGGAMVLRSSNLSLDIDFTSSSSGGTDGGGGTRNGGDARNGREGTTFSCLWIAACGPNTEKGRPSPPCSSGGSNSTALFQSKLFQR
jgi:hypothetical protein